MALSSLHSPAHYTFFPRRGPDASVCSIETAAYIDDNTPSTTYLALPVTGRANLDQNLDDDEHGNSTASHWKWSGATTGAVSKQHQLFDVSVNPTTTSSHAACVSHAAVHGDSQPQTQTERRYSGSNNTSSAEVISPERAACVILHAGGKEQYMKKMKALFSVV